MSAWGSRDVADASFNVGLASFKYACVCVYIYIYREREIYIYIYLERERGRERERKWELAAILRACWFQRWNGVFKKEQP